MKKIIIGFLLLFLIIKCWAQQADSIVTTPLPDTLLLLDSTGAKKGIFTFFSSDYPNPKKAALLALVVPGAGQIYNKRWWKLPLVYGAMGGMVYAISFNQGEYRRYKTAYALKLTDQPHEFTNTRYDDTRILRLVRDGYDKNTQLSYIGLVFVYALQAVEAFVDSHLKTFSVDEDLSLQLKPSFQPSTLDGQPTLGVGVALRFK